MDEIVPKYLCGSCQRGVLNRRVKHCLYCGAQLAAAVLSTPEEIAVADEQERCERETYALSAPAQVAQPSAEFEGAFGAVRIAIYLSGAV